MSNEIAVRNQPLAQIRAALSEESLAQLEAALPEDVSPTRFLQIANTAVLRDQNLARPQLRQSLFLAAMKCATAGLLPDGEQAVLAAFGNEVTFMPMIAGYRHIAGLHGWDLRGYVVYENDEFDYQLGDEPRVTHRPPKLGHDRGAEIGAYATATHRDGTVKVEVMDMEAINAIAAKASNKTLWKPGTHTRTRMIEKTPAKALFKRLPLGEREHDRIRRMLDESGALDVDTATGELYGPTDSAAPASISPPGGGGADLTPEEARADEPPQGTGGGDTDPRAASTSPPPEDAGGTGPEQVDLWAEELTEDFIDIAGRTPIPAGDYHGRMIEQVARTKAGRAFLLKILRTVDETDETRRAIAVFCEARVPEVWKQFTAGGAWAA